MKMFETITTTTTTTNTNTNTTDLNSLNTNSSSDEHEELLAEMELIERLPTQERLKQAKRRRALQLKKWSDYERECLTSKTTTTTNNNNNNLIDNEISQDLKHHHHINRNSFTRSSNKTRKKHSNQSNRGLKNRSIKFQDHIVLLDAIMRKDFEEVERLLNSDITPNSANEDGLTAIHQVCFA
jgi:hypothetical protein